MFHYQLQPALSDTPYVPSFVRMRMDLDLEMESTLLTFNLPALPYYVHSYANRWTVTQAQQQ